ncbi:MAG: DUF2834 domain-containing protein [Pseudomonadota bacterium]
MTKDFFEGAVLVVGAGFAVAFSVIVIPALLETGDVPGAFAAGFVNPFSSGYSLDVILCGAILVIWMLYERSALKIRHGWVVVPLSFTPGVATAFAVYLVMRSRQLQNM